MAWPRETGHFFLIYIDQFEEEELNLKVEGNVFTKSLSNDLKASQKALNGAYKLLMHGLHIVI